MDLKTITECFLQTEQEFGFFNHKIGGVHFWELVRWNVHRLVLFRKGLHGEAHEDCDKRLVNQIRALWRPLKNIFHANPFLFRPCDILFYGHPRRKKMDDGLYWDPFSDPIIDRIGKSFECLLFETAFLNTHLSPPKTKRIGYLDLPHFIAAISRSFKFVRFSMSAEEKKKLTEMQTILQKRFDVRLDDLMPIISEVIYFRKSVLPFYTFILKKVRPKMVILICSYCGKEIFIEVCSKLGIPVVELQHGTSMGRYHLGYSYPSRCLKKTFPDYLLTFGDFWKLRAKYPIGLDKIFSVGFPFHDLESEKYRKIEKRKQVLFISQGTVGAAMSKLAVRVAKRLDKPFRIVYKLHPGEYGRWKKEYPWLVESGMRVLDDDKMPLYRLFAESEIQVGVYSTAIYEGLGFGLKTYLIDLPGVEYMIELIENKAASVISSADELIAKILNPAEENRMKAEYYFKPNALENTEDIIEKIMREKDKLAYSPH